MFGRPLLCVCFIAGGYLIYVLFFYCVNASVICSMIACVYSNRRHVRTVINTLAENRVYCQVVKFRFQNGYKIIQILKLKYVILDVKRIGRDFVPLSYFLYVLLCTIKWTPGRWRDCPWLYILLTGLHPRKSDRWLTWKSHPNYPYPLVDPCVENYISLQQT